MDAEKRIFTGKLEVREHGDGEEPSTITGYAAVFNSRSVEMWGWYEEITPGAFTETLAAGPDVRATIDHDGGTSTIGRTKNGTLHLTEDDVGLRVSIVPPDTQAGRDVLTLVRRGDVDQMSFMFRVPKGGERWETLEDGTMIRHLKQIELDDGDVSIVTYPAYPETSAEVRDKAAAVSQAAAAANEEPDSGQVPDVARKSEARRRQISLLRRL